MQSKNDAIWRRAKFLAQRSDREEIQSITLLIMYDLEMPLNCSGFDYLKNVIPVAVKKPSQIVVKELFQEVGEQYSPKVEYYSMDRAIHDVIEKAWVNNRRNRWKCYFPDYILENDKAPTNAEFIAGLTYFLEMWQNCCKEGHYAKK